MQILKWKVVTVCCCIAIASCSSSDKSNEGTAPVATDEPFDGLRIVGDKEAFSSAIKAALLNTLSGNGGGQYPVTTDLDVVESPAAPVPVAAPGAAPEADSAGGSDDTPLQVTETNVQETGVDESDRIKSDGRYLYVLNTTYGDTGVPVPAPEQVPVTEPEPVDTDFSSRTSIPYEPNGKAQVRVLSLDNEAADAQLLQTLEMDTDNQRADGLYLYQTDADQSLIVTTSSMYGYWGYWGAPIEFLGEKSTVHKVDIADPSTASVGDSLQLDGQIVSSRRIGDYLYVATRFFPWIDGVDPYGSDQQVLEQTIDNTPIEDLLPKATRVSDNQVQQLAQAEKCFVASKPRDVYYAPDIVTLAVIDLRSLSVSDSVCYLGASETLYASTNAVYLATTEWNYGYPEVAVVDAPVPVEGDGGSGSGDEPVVEPPEPEILPPEPGVTTAIHQFNIDGGNLRYAGSGKVAGHLGWDFARKPYRMGEKDGHLRVVTYDDLQDGNRSPVSLSVLKPSGDGHLDLVARLPNEARPAHIGKPREQLYASRFLGNKAYLVTFRQIDPLYIIDLSDPADPYIAGELEIPGYSDYLRPIGENHLLGIGRGALPANGGNGDDRGAFAQGVKISLFDVANPAAPAEVQSIEIGKRGSYSNALNNPHGITVQLGSAGAPSRLAIGIDVNDVPTAYSNGPSGWYEWRESGLFGFEIRTDANAGISEHGKMIVESRTGQQIYGPQRGDDRSVIVNDAVFYIHGEQVFGANWNSLGNFNGPR